MNIVVPAPRNYGEWDMESFEDYSARWPLESSRLPTSLVETWVHRHWPEFSSFWLPAGALSWRYELRRFSNMETLGIAASQRTMELLTYWGEELMFDKLRQRTWLGKYMLENGSTPEAILVFEGGGKIEHPRESPGEMMVEPFQLIEGHMRLAYLRSMIRNGWPSLQAEHEVWVATPQSGEDTQHVA